MPQSIHQKFGCRQNRQVSRRKRGTGLDTQIVISAAEHVAVAVVCESNLRTADVWMFAARVMGLIPISILLPRRFRHTFKDDEHCMVVFDAALAQVWLRIIRSGAVEPRFTMGCGQCRGVKPEARGCRSQGAPGTGLRSDSSHVGTMVGRSTGSDPLANGSHRGVNVV